MRRHFARAIVTWILALILALGGGALAQPPADATRFDGTWSGVYVCPDTPDGVFGYTWVLSVAVRGGHLRGQHGIVGKPDSATFDGVIQPPVHAFGRVSPGTVFSYHIDARFDATRGHGKRMEQRPCEADLVKNR
jgi:hypothetical protein